jgi:hypothetical protein
MSVKTLSLAATLTLSVALLLGGCKKSAPPAEPAQVPNSDGSVSQPAPQSSNAPATAAAPAPGTVAPGSPGTAPDAGSAMQGPPVPAASPAVATPPPPPPPQTLTARVGTPVTVTITERLSASHNSVGDRFTGVLAAPVRSSGGGGTIFPRGARVLGTVVASKGQGKFKGSGALGIQVNSIAGTRVSVSSYEKEQAGKGKRTAGFIGGGAGGGALIGGLAGGGKGALIGGLLGGGAGTAGAAFTGNKDVVIPSESTVTFHLTAPVTITVQP